MARVLPCSCAWAATWSWWKLKWIACAAGTPAGSRPGTKAFGAIYSGSRYNARRGVQMNAPALAEVMMAQVFDEPINTTDQSLDRVLAAGLPVALVFLDG